MTSRTRRRSQRFIRHIFEGWHICGRAITLPRPQSFRRSSLTPVSLDGVSLVPWPGSSTPEPSTQWVWTPQREFHTNPFSPFGRMLTLTYRSIRPRGPSTKRCATVTNGNNRYQHRDVLSPIQNGRRSHNPARRSAPKSLVSFTDLRSPQPTAAPAPPARGSFLASRNELKNITDAQTARIENTSMYASVAACA